MAGAMNLCIGGPPNFFPRFKYRYLNKKTIPAPPPPPTPHFWYYSVHKRVVVNVYLIHVNYNSLVNRPLYKTDILLIQKT